MRALSLILALCGLLAVWGLSSCARDTLGGDSDTTGSRSLLEQVEALIEQVGSEEALAQVEQLRAALNARIEQERQAAFQAWVFWLSLVCGLGALVLLGLGIWLSALRGTLWTCAAACGAMLAVLRVAARIYPWLPYVGAVVLVGVGLWLYWRFAKADPRALRKSKKTPVPSGIAEAGGTH